MTTGERIRSARRDREMTQEQLAPALGVSLATVNKWERDVVKPGYDNWLTLCEFFGWDHPDLVGSVKGRYPASVVFHAA